MDVQEVQEYLMTFANATSSQFDKIPGSAIIARYIKSSYQDDPVRSAVELFLVLFAIRYLLAPKYSTKPNYVKLSEEVRSEQRPLEALRANPSVLRRSMTWLRTGLLNLLLPNLARSKKQMLKRGL